MNFWQTSASNCRMNGIAKPTRDNNGETAPNEAPETARSGFFAFGARRYASKGPRRLFIPRRSIPAFEVEIRRPRAILRLRST